MEVLTDHPETALRAGCRAPSGKVSDEPLTIATAEAVADGPGWRLRFAEMGSRDAADRLRGAYLQAAVLPELELGRGEYYWHEVMGVTVRGVDGTDLGTVRDVYRIGENEVFSVEGGPFGASSCRPSGRSSGSSPRAAARSSSTPNRWTCVRRACAALTRTGRRRRAATTRRPKGSAPAAAADAPAEAPALAEPPAPAQAVEPSAPEP